MPRSSALVAALILAILLALLAAWRWQRVVTLVADRWDGQTTDRREDVVAYYAAGRLVADGRGGELYDPKALALAEEDILGRPAGRYGGLAYFNPPFLAGLLQPLARLPYGQAQALWFALNAAALLAAILVLLPELLRLPRSWAVVSVLAVLASFPVFWSFLYGQSSSFILLSWALSYRLLKGGREGLAGCALAATLIKPSLALTLPFFLLAMGRRRALLAFGASGAVLVGLSLAVAGPHETFISYPRLLLESTRWQKEYGVDRAHMYGWTPFFRMMLPDATRLFPLLLGGLASALTLLAAVYVWRSPRRAEDDSRMLLSLATASILISPHTHAQDLQIFFLPLLVAHHRSIVDEEVLVWSLLLIPARTIAVTVTTPLLAASLAVAVVRRRFGANAARPGAPAAVRGAIR